MERSHVTYLIIGGGPAAAHAAEAIRMSDGEGSILIVGREVTRPYARNELAGAYLRREKSRHDLSLRGPSWYVHEKIQLRSGQRVVLIDTARKFVSLDTGAEIAFDKLLIATGATARPLALPGASMSNVYHLRSVEDFDRLLNAIVGPMTDDRSKSEMRTPPSRTRVCVIGSGPLGTEVAASLRVLGAKIELVCGGAHPWPEIVGPTLGAIIHQSLSKQGVNIHQGVRAMSLQGDGRVQRVVLSDQSAVECDHVVACVGVDVSRELLRSTPIAAERGILADEFGRTSVRDVFAAGDCCAMFDPRFAKHRLTQHWAQAVYAGGIVGANMAASVVGGDMKPVSQLIGYVSQLDPRTSIHLQSWGEARLIDYRIVRGAGNDTAEIGADLNGRCVHVSVIGRADEHAVLKSLVESRAPLTTIAERLKNPDIPL